MHELEYARQFAHEAHDSIGQKRKFSGLPYWVHTDEVGDIVGEVVVDERLVIVGYFHDILEDVMPLNPRYSVERLRQEWGDWIVDHVIELTDVFTKESWPQYNRAERKRLEVARVSTISPESMTVKLADLLSNTKDIVAEDPKFAPVYLDEKGKMLRVLQKGNANLYERAVESWQNGLKLIGQNPITF